MVRPWCSTIFGSVSWRQIWPKHDNLRRLTVYSKFLTSGVKIVSTRKLGQLAKISNSLYKREQGTGITLSIIVTLFKIIHLVRFVFFVWLVLGMTVNCLHRVIPLPHPGANDLSCRSAAKTTTHSLYAISSIPPCSISFQKLGFVSPDLQSVSTSHTNRTVKFSIVLENMGHLTSKRDANLKY